MLYFFFWLQDIIKSTFRGIVSDELKSIKDSSLDINFGDPTLITADDDAIWDYDGLHTACQGDCEEILLEMQRIFYDDLRMEESKKGILGRPSYLDVSAI